MTVIENFVPIFLGTFVIAMAVYLAFAGQSRSEVVRARLHRTARPINKEGSHSATVPSIVRERNNFLRRNAAYISNASLRSLANSFDSLLRISGFSWNSACVVILILSLLCVLSSIMVASIVKVSALYILLFLITASTLIFIKMLVYLKARRLERFQQVFPEALDLIVRSVRAGLPVSEAIKVISEEVSPPVNDAFREVASHLSIGMTLEESLEVLQKNVPLAEVKFFAISLSIQQETGGNLAEILANSASIMRKRAQLAKKIKAFSSEARASALIIGSLPFVVGAVIYLLNREYLEVLFFDQVGQIFLIAAISSIGVGALVIAKMIKFEV